MDSVVESMALTTCLINNNEILKNNVKMLKYYEVHSNL